MARQIPSGQKILTHDASLDTAERGSSGKKNKSEYYTIDDIIFTAGGDSAGSSGALTEGISMTNDDGAFDHLPTLYSDGNIPAGTSIEALLRTILNPYATSTLSISTITVAYDDSTNNTVENLNSPKILENGQKVHVKTIGYNVGDHTKVLDDSVRLLQDNIQVLTGIDDEGDSVTYSHQQTISNISGGVVSLNYKLQATDNGNTGIETTISSSTKSFKWYDRLRIGASNVASLGNGNDGANALFGNLNIINSLQEPSDVSFNGNNTTDNPLNRTWIAHPLSWTIGDIKSGATSVKVDFSGPFQKQVTNAYGVDIYYHFWVSNSFGAFDADDFLTVEFT